MTMSREQQLDTLTDQVRAAVSSQREEADAAHEDFYAWGWALSDMLNQLDHLCRTLDHQIAHYGDARVLRDDEGADPYERLSEMRAKLSGVQRQLGGAEAAAREFHSAASHIAVEVSP